MGEHDTFYTLLMPDFWARLTETAAANPVIGERTWKAAMFQGTHYTLTHVMAAVIAFVFLVIAALFYKRSTEDKSEGVVPPREWTLAAMTGNFVNATFNMTADVMGEEDARRYLPFVGTFALFIFCCNIQGLIPGLLPATDTLKTNLALALLVFVVYNVVAVRSQGLAGYIGHLCGPKFSIFGLPEARWLTPLMLPIELASHIARPVSLSLRLMGNMVADHKVVGAMLMLLPLLIPVPFLLLGTLVCIVQTLVFTLLTVIYLSLALDHSEEH